MSDIRSKKRKVAPGTRKKKVSEDDSHHDDASNNDTQLVSSTEPRKRTKIVMPKPNLAPKLPKSINDNVQKKRLFVVLERACLETVKRGHEYQLLNSDDHISYMKKKGRDPGTARPDITHQCLLMLLDSPLNKAGLLQVFIHTENNVLIEINPQTRIPRTFKRFAGLMVQLLHKYSIRAANGPVQLMKVVKNPVTDHLPTGTHVIGTSFSHNACVRLSEFVPTLPDERTTCFVLGAMAHGKADADYVDERISFSNYPLSAHLACAKVCEAFEAKYDVL